MSDGGGDCGGDYSYDGGYSCNETTTYDNTTTNVAFDDGPTIENTYTENNFYIGGGIGGGGVDGCQTIYDGGFQPAYHVGMESISFGGGIQPCYDTDFHTIAVGVGDPCYVEPHVYPVYPADTAISTAACIFVCIILTTMFVIFIIMGKFQCKTSLSNFCTIKYTCIYGFVFSSFVQLMIHISHAILFF